MLNVSNKDKHSYNGYICVHWKLKAKAKRFNKYIELKSN